jgi:hypothetical protein
MPCAPSVKNAPSGQAFSTPLLEAGHENSLAIREKGSRLRMDGIRQAADVNGRNIQ